MIEDRVSIERITVKKICILFASFRFNLEVSIIRINCNLAQEKFNYLFKRIVINENLTTINENLKVLTIKNKIQ